MTYSMQTNEWPYTDLTDERFRAIDKAAKAGDAEAFFSLGYIYERGNGDIVQQSDTKALYCYKKACDLGYAQAHMRMGKVYELGRLGYTRDIHAAGWHYGEAYELGLDAAEEDLSRMVAEMEERDAKFDASERAEKALDRICNN